LLEAATQTSASAGPDDAKAVRLAKSGSGQGVASMVIDVGGPHRLAHVEIGVGGDSVHGNGTAAGLPTGSAMLFS